MRSTCVLVALLVACGGDAKVVDPDAAPSDALCASDGIAAARAACTMSTGCVGLSLGISCVTVTSLRQPIRGDPAGFTIQAQQAGPGMFIAVDPATLIPSLHVGDVVSLTITGMSYQPELRATSLTDLTVHQTGTDVMPLVQDISDSPSLDYDGMLVSVTGTIAMSNPNTFGSGYPAVPLDTAGTHGNPNFQVRFPTELMSGFDGTMGCRITIPKAPFVRYHEILGEGPTPAFFQIALSDASDYTLTDCTGPKIQLAVSLSPSSVKLAFDRDIKASSVIGDGSQFTFDNGLTASAATVTGNTITVTTSAQSSSTNYTITIANSVTDLHGTGATSGGTFAGYVTPAIVRINELTASQGYDCDLIELRVVRGGPMTATGTANSIQRIDNNDTNSKGDWTTGAGAASTWGALNVGQTALPVAHRTSQR